MPTDPRDLPLESIRVLLESLADDELMLGHRNSEWTGHAPILEEDIAFSNIAEDELGHSIVWYTLLAGLNGKTPDQMAFERQWNEFTCCRMVTYPRGDFAYTVARQYLFDEAEQVRLESFANSTYEPLRLAAVKILREEAYHLMHSKGLMERLGDGTAESHSRMQQALEIAFPQALGIFEELKDESGLVAGGVFPGNQGLKDQWMQRILSGTNSATLTVPISFNNGRIQASVAGDLGGRKKSHNQHLKELVDDLQSVYRTEPGGSW